MTFTSIHLWQVDNKNQASAPPVNTVEEKPANNDGSTDSAADATADQEQKTPVCSPKKCWATFYIWTGWMTAMVAAIVVTYLMVSYMASTAKSKDSETVNATSVVTLVTPCGENYFWHLGSAAGLLSNVFGQYGSSLDGRGAARARVLDLPSWFINRTLVDGTKQFKEFKRFRVENRLGYSFDVVSLGASMTSFKVLYLN